MEIKREAYFITGASGFLGSHILKNILKNKNATVFAFLMENDKGAKRLENHSNVHLCFGNLLNKDSVNNFLSLPFDGDKYLIHCAGKITTLKKHDSAVMKINYEGSKNIVDCAKNIDFKKIIYISSVDSLSIVKDNNEILEQNYYFPDKVAGIYGKSKALANNYFLDNLPNSVIILPSALYGPDDPLNCPINFAIQQFISNKMPALVKGGYNLVDVRDVADAIVSACYLSKNGQSYILGGNNISIKDICLKCHDITGCKNVKFFVPHFIIKLISPFIVLFSKIKHKTPIFTGFSMDCLKQNSNYSHQKASRELNFKIRDLDESFKDTIKFLKEEKIK